MVSVPWADALASSSSSATSKPVVEAFRCEVPALSRRMPVLSRPRVLTQCGSSLRLHLAQHHRRGGEGLGEGYLGSDVADPPTHCRIGGQRAHHKLPPARHLPGAGLQHDVAQRLGGVGTILIRRFVDGLNIGDAHHIRNLVVRCKAVTRCSSPS